MKTAHERGTELGDRRPQGIRWPLAGSAAGHLLFLALFLLVGASVDTHIARVVPVLLVEGEAVAPPGAGHLVPMSPGRPARPAAVLGGGAAGRSLAAASAGSGEPPPVPVAISPKSGRLRTAEARASSSAIPVPHPSANRALPPSAQTQRQRSVVAVPSGGPAPAGPIAAPGEGAARALRIGATAPPIGERDAAKAGEARGVVAGGAPDGRMAAGVSGPPGPAAGGQGEGREASVGPLGKKIQSAIVYPEEAIRRGIEGEVLLRIRVGERGIPREIRIARSSGARTLDDAARRGVVRAVPLPSAPGWFEVPVRFRLR